MGQDEKDARQKTASMNEPSAAAKKKVASTEEPQDSQRERAGRQEGNTSRNRLRLLARRCKLEEELDQIKQILKVHESDLLEADDVRQR